MELAPSYLDKILVFFLYLSLMNVQVPNLGDTVADVTSRTRSNNGG